MDPGLSASPTAARIVTLVKRTLWPSVEGRWVMDTGRFREIEAPTDDLTDLCKTAECLATWTGNDARPRSLDRLDCAKRLGSSGY